MQQVFEEMQMLYEANLEDIRYILIKVTSKTLI